MQNQKKPHRIEPSPKGFGFSAHLENVDTVKQGTDGNLWMVGQDKNGRKFWKKLKTENVIETEFGLIQQSQQPQSLLLQQPRSQSRLLQQQPLKQSKVKNFKNDIIYHIILDYKTMGSSIKETEKRSEDEKENLAQNSEEWDYENFIVDEKNQTISFDMKVPNKKLNPFQIAEKKMIISAWDQFINDQYNDLSPVYPFEHDKNYETEESDEFFVEEYNSDNENIQNGNENQNRNVYSLERNFSRK